MQQNRQIINTDQSLPEVELANNRMCFQTVLQTIAGTYPNVHLIFEFLKITDLPGILSKQNLIRLLTQQSSRFVQLGLVESEAVLRQLVQVLKTESSDETTDDYSTENSDSEQDGFYFKFILDLPKPHLGYILTSSNR